MHRYFFILGRYPTISFAELKSVTQRMYGEYNFLCISKEVVIIETTRDWDIQSLVNRLGGVVKAGIVQDQISLDAESSKLETIFSIEHLSQKYISNSSGKFHIGMSVYDGGSDRTLLEKLSGNLKSLCLEVKNNLKTRGIRAGFVRVKERYLSSVSVVKNGLLKNGLEIVLIITHSSVCIGKTIAVQDFENFSFRDMERPCLDKRSGILPTKLARIMVNVAAAGENDRLLDPFCGSGTILQEAILLGVRFIFGSDKSKIAIVDSQQNIQWLKQKYLSAPLTNIQIKLFQSDVSNLRAHVPLSSIDRIVTEPYLGPPILRVPDKQTILRILREVEMLYIAAFREFATLVKASGNIVIVFPSFPYQGNWFFADVLPQIAHIGFMPVPLLTTEEIALLNGVNTGRGSLLYGSPHQFIYRELLKFEKVR